MEKFKARKLRRLKAQKEGWGKAFQLISRKYKPSQKVEDIQRLLKDCGSGTVNFTDRPIDAATEDELNAISKKFSIECKVHERTTRQYYILAKEKIEQFTKDFDEFEANYKVQQRDNLIAIVLVAGVIAIPFGIVVNSKSFKYQRAEEYMQKENYDAALKWYSKCENYLDAGDKAKEAELKIIAAVNPEYKLVEAEGSSPEEIYTLGNEIPCGLVKYHISYDDLLNAKENYLDKTEDTLTYGDYSLYGYTCEIKYYFGSMKLLKKIEVISPYMPNKENFTDEDVKKIVNEIQDELEVSPFIQRENSCLYKFLKNDIFFRVDREEKNSRFCLVITADKR